MNHCFLKLKWLYWIISVTESLPSLTTTQLVTQHVIYWSKGSWKNRIIRLKTVADHLKHFVSNCGDLCWNEQPARVNLQLNRRCWLLTDVCLNDNALHRTTQINKCAESCDVVRLALLCSYLCSPRGRCTFWQSWAPMLFPAGTDWSDCSQTPDLWTIKHTLVCNCQREHVQTACSKSGMYHFQSQSSPTTLTFIICFTLNETIIY